MTKKSFILLFLVLLLGSVLRFWQLGKVPISPDWDEVSLGYNAYSITQTERDEYGKFLPIVMRSYDDYKPALYSYLTIPSIAVLGLNVFAVRLPSAIFGLVTILAVYFLLRELFGEKNLKLEAKGFVVDIPLLTSFLLGISPWHIQFSRVAFESNVGLSFNILAALFFIKGLKKPMFLSLSAIFSALSFYVYQSEKVFTPLLIAALVIIFRSELFKKPKKYILAAVILGFAIILPMLFYTFGNKNALQRAQGVSIFADSTQLLSDNTKRLLIDKQNHDILGLIVDNRRVLFAKEMISGYLSHFNLNWLSITGDIARHHAPQMGLLYLFELPFLFIGIYMLLFGAFNKKTKLFILFWFLLVPIPASVTSGVPHAVRTLNFLPTFQIFVAIGIIFAAQKISNLKSQILNIQFKHLIFGLGFIFAIFNFAYFLNQYFVQQNYFDASQWQYGYENVVPKIKDLTSQYKKIIVSNQAPMDQSYMFFLFYLRYPSKLYEQQSAGSSGGFREDHTFGKFEFRNINWQKDQKLGNTLFIGRPSDFPTSSNIIYKAFYPDRSGAMEIVSRR